MRHTTYFFVQTSACVCVFACMCVCVCVCVCPPEDINNYSGMIWTLYDWLNNLHSFYVAAVVSIISRHGPSIHAHHENQPNQQKVALCI